MQFFLPSLLIFLIAMIATAFIAPRITPWIAAILALAFLTYGIHEHYSMFAYEYKQSTWQEGLKVYAPFIIVGGIIVFCMYGMVAFFTGGTVPVPSMPSMPAMNSMPSMNSLSLSSMGNSLSSVANSITNSTTNLINSANRSLNNRGNRGNQRSMFSLAEAI